MRRSPDAWPCALGRVCGGGRWITAVALAIIVAATTAACVTSAETPTGLPAFAPDEPLVLTYRVTGAGGGLFVRRPDGSGDWQLATDILPGVHKHPDWSPDGQHVVFVDEATERMWIAHLDGSPTESVPTCDTPGCDYPAWAPDGKRIAFSRVENADGVVGPAAVGIHVLDLATGEVSPVARLERPLLVDVPRWSPDGAELVVGVDQMDEEAFDTGAAIAVVPATGGEPRYLTSFETWAYGADWSWVTGEIVFGPGIRATMRDFDPAGETWDIFGIAPDGSGLRQITHAGPGDRFASPHWTPDGTAISAYSWSLGSGVLVDPVDGSFKAVPTGPNEGRPLIRPAS
jgi:Tol biopolymer transport system component